MHRNLLAHVVGLLSLGSAITLAAAVFAPSLPGAIELAGTFDAVFATFIAIAVARAVILHDPRLDIRSLRGLRG
jgi:hydrogenase-4 membrane subunit HyfE